MNDESQTPEAELASAALDNEVTATERARIAGSKDLTAELSFYTEMRAQLVDVTAPPGALDSAIAAALAVFDEAPATELAPVVSLHQRRQRQYRWLGGAAAAAVVLVVAAAVVNISASDSDKNSTAAFSSPTSIDQKVAGPAQPAAATEGGGAAATDGVADAAVTNPAAAGSAEAAEGTPATTTATDGELVITGPAEVSPWVSAPTLDTPEDVLAYAQQDTFATATSGGAATASGPATQSPVPSETSTAATTSPEASTQAIPAPTAPTSAYGTSPGQCPGLFVGPSAAVIYQGQQVVVVRDDADNQIVVIDPVGCVVITTLPSQR